MTDELPPRFDPATIEARWQAFWAEREYFRAPVAPNRPPFTIPHPPPNVTGILTMGHMLGDTIRDTLTRWHRMRGEPTLWQPGLDHAGLSTQVEVRRTLAKQGVDLDGLPREEVLRHVEAWKADHERHILAQERAGGFSIDWTRYRYTLDDGAKVATRRAFVRLHQEGLIYRGERIVNWDPKLRTALSDLEVRHSEEDAELLYLRYPWSDGTPGGVTIATVRPETIFGDVAVAVHPDDERHRAEVGRKVRVPLTARDVPVITDAGIDPKFGTGALKVTPRHDALDFDVYRRHPDAGIPMPPSILDDTGRLDGDWVPVEYRGLDRFDARGLVSEKLRADGFVERAETIRHSVGRSERSHAVIEPMLSKQWFVRLAELAPPVVDAVRNGDVKIHPDRWTRTFFRWMEGLQDWCISRQVVWGHPIPVYYCATCSHELAAEEAPQHCPNCGATGLRPDPDVLDTWFTSWMWPFLMLGWPDRTADLDGYYPASVLVTGRDIMFFWVARMMMAGSHFMGRPPFRDVYFTGMLRDDTGRKMSKSLGNSPDPLNVVRDHGADPMRFALLFPNPVDQDGAFGTATLEGSRNFLTKLWNLVRFAAPFLPSGTEPARSAPMLHAASALENRWILSRWTSTSQDVDGALEAFEFTRAAGLLYQFVWHDVADRYVEAAKDALQGKRGEPAEREARTTLLFVLERSLRQLHPMVPHITEELWHHLPHVGESLAVAPWPLPAEGRRDPEAEIELEIVWDAIRSMRNLRAEHQVPVRSAPLGFARPASPTVGAVLEREKATIVRLTRVQEFRVLRAADTPSARSARSVSPHAEYFVELPLESTAAETEGLAREREKLRTLLDKTKARLADPGFVARAPPDVVRETEAKAKELTERLEKIDGHLEPPAGEVDA